MMGSINHRYYYTLNATGRNKSAVRLTGVEHGKSSNRNRHRRSGSETTRYQKSGKRDDYIGSHLSGHGAELRMRFHLINVVCSRNVCVYIMVVRVRNFTLDRFIRAPIVTCLVDWRDLFTNPHPLQPPVGSNLSSFLGRL